MMLRREPDRYVTEITLLRNEGKSKQEQRHAALAIEIQYDTDDILASKAVVRYYLPRAAAVDLRDKMSEILDARS